MTKSRGAIGCALVAGVMVCVGWRVYSNVRQGFTRMKDRWNLKEPGLVVANYRHTYRCLPPVWITDDEGRPMHSWRVLLLPFLGYEDLYAEYNFSKPWDGPPTTRHLRIAGRCSTSFTELMTMVGQTPATWPSSVIKRHGRLTACGSSMTSKMERRL